MRHCDKCGGELVDMNCSCCEASSSGSTPEAGEAQKNSPGTSEKAKSLPAVWKLALGAVVLALVGGLLLPRLFGSDEGAGVLQPSEGVIGVLDPTEDGYFDFYLVDGVDEAFGGPLTPEDRVLRDVVVSEELYWVNQGAVEAASSVFGARQVGSPLFAYNQKGSRSWTVGRLDGDEVVELLDTDNPPEIYELDSGTYVVDSPIRPGNCQLHQIDGHESIQLANARECYLYPSADIALLRDHNGSESWTSILHLDTGDISVVDTRTLDPGIGLSAQAFFSRNLKTVLLIFSYGTSPRDEEYDSRLVDLSSGEVIAEVDGLGIAALDMGFLALQQRGEELVHLYVDAEGSTDVVLEGFPDDMVVNPIGAASRTTPAGDFVRFLVGYVDDGNSRDRIHLLGSAPVSDSGIGPVEHIFSSESRRDAGFLPDGREVLAFAEGSVVLLDGMEFEQIDELDSDGGTGISADVYDGQVVLISNDSHSAVVVPDADPRLIAVDGIGEITGASLSEDGRWLAVAGPAGPDDNGSKMYLVDIGGSGEVRFVVESDIYIDPVFYGGQLYYETYVDRQRQTHRYSPDTDTIEDLGVDLKLVLPRSYRLEDSYYKWWSEERHIGE